MVYPSIALPGLPGTRSDLAKRSTPGCVIAQPGRVSRLGNEHLFSEASQ